MSAAPTIVHALIDRAALDPRAPALWGKVGSTWRRLSWAMYATSARQAAKGLVRLDVAPGELVGLWGEPRPDQVVASAGVLAAGAVVGVLEAPTEQDVAERLERLSPGVLICADVFRLATARAIVDERNLPVRRFVVLDAVTAHDARMLTLDDLMSLGASTRDDQVEARLAALSPSAPALRTPEHPEPLTHRELLALGEHLASHVVARADRRARVVADGTLASALQHVAALVLPALVGAEVWFRPDGSGLGACLAEVSPDLACATPEAWALVASAIEARLASEGGVRGGLLHWATGIERAATAGGRDGLARQLARRLVLDTVRTQLGFERLALALSTEAPPASAVEALAALGAVLRGGELGAQPGPERAVE